MYRKEKLVHASGGSQVWKARLPDGSSVALKFSSRRGGYGIQHEAAVSEVLSQRTCRRSTRGLVLALDSFTEDGRLALVFPWADLGDASTAFLGTKPLSHPSSELILWRAARDLSSGLSTIHDLGVCHRDIKPSNCLVFADGSVALSDFGISLVGCANWSDTKRPDTLSVTQSECCSDLSKLEHVGTSGFMAPELDGLTGARYVTTITRLRAHAFAAGCIGPAPCRSCCDMILLARAIDMWALGATLAVLAASPQFTSNGVGLSTEWTTMVESLCNVDPASRPSAGSILAVCELNLVFPFVGPIASQFPSDNSTAISQKLVDSSTQSHLQSASNIFSPAPSPVPFPVPSPVLSPVPLPVPPHPEPPKPSASRLHGGAARIRVKQRSKRESTALSQRSTSLQAASLDYLVSTAASSDRLAETQTEAARETECASRQLLAAETITMPLHVVPQRRYDETATDDARKTVEGSMCSNLAPASVMTVPPTNPLVPASVATPAVEIADSKEQQRRDIDARLARRRDRAAALMGRVSEA